MTDSTRPRHPALAATLSFLFPGLGQAYAGQRGIALVLAVPVLLLIGAALVAAILLGDRLRNEVLSSSFLAALLALDVALLAWRLFAILHAALARPAVLAMQTAGDTHTPRVPPFRANPATLATVAVLAVLAIAMHLYFAIVLGRLEAALDRVFSGGGVTRPITSPADSGATPGPTDPPLNRPEYQWDGTDRVNFLLIGTDAAPGRENVLTDTILVVSVDPVAYEAVMVSIPRDTGYMPLPDTSVYAEGVYPEKINELVGEADEDPELWCPDLPPDAECGIRTLERSVGLYLGIEIHYYALVDLSGFAELVNAVGGVELCLPGRLEDETYLGADGTGPRGVALPAGCHEYDGEDALAYARIRRGELVLPDGTVEEQNDFERAARQQEVLLAMRRELAEADLFFELPGLLNAVAETVTTDFPRDRAGDLASLLPLIAGPDIERVVLGLPDYVDPPVAPEVNYLLIPRRDEIREVAEQLFGGEGPLRGWYVGSDAPLPPDASGAATPTPEPSPS